MTSHDQAAGRKPRGGNAGAGARQGDGDSSLASPADLAEGFKQLSLPAPSPEAVGRMEARFTRMVDAGDPGPLARALAWFGFGTAGPRLSPRMAAGALLVLAIGGTASTAAGVSPLRAAGRAGEVVRNIVTNLDPTSGDDAALAPADTPTASPEASRSPDTSGNTPAASTTSTSEPLETPEPTETPETATVSPGSPGGGSSGPPASTANPTETPEPSETPDPGETPAPSETPEPSKPPDPTETPDGTETAAPSKTVPPSATPTPDPSATPGTSIYPAGSAGSVELARAGDDDLDIVAVTTEPGWTADIERQSGKDVEVVFKSDGQEIHFSATVVNGEVEVTIDTHG